MSRQIKVQFKLVSETINKTTQFHSTHYIHDIQCSGNIACVAGVGMKKVINKNAREMIFVVSACELVITTINYLGKSWFEFTEVYRNGFKYL